MRRELPWYDGNQQDPGGGRFLAQGPGHRVHRGRIRQGERAGPVTPAELHDQLRVGPARGHALDPELLREMLDQLQRAPPHGAGDTQHGQPLHAPRDLA